MRRFERERIPRHDCAGDVAALGLVPPLVISPPPFPVFVRGLALSVCALCVGRSRVQKECRSASDECRPLLLRPSSMHWGGARGRPLAMMIDDTLTAEDTATMPNVRQGKDE